MDQSTRKPHNRRDFLSTALVTAGGFAVANSQSRPQAAHIMTVLGPISPMSAGTVLPHEHVMVDFVGADQVSPSRYEPEEVFQTALPHLRRAYELGCRTFVECTPAYLGRDPLILKRLASASGLHMITNTGYYGAAEDKYVPRHAYGETAEQLAARWIEEWRQGIDGTGIRPGFLKIGVDSGPLSTIDQKLVRAAAVAHLETGLTIAAHTGDSVAALEQVRILKDFGVEPAAWIWVHAKMEEGSDALEVVAKEGGWVEFDSIAPHTVEIHVNLVAQMKRAGFLTKVLVSQDAGWYHVGEEGGGNFRPFDSLFIDFLPGLRRVGFSSDEIRLLTEVNPAAAFSVRVRKL
jgi:predicted metal-dependent phosphotriesterase family hydrolase